ncbi:MAG: septation protein SepH [Actinomycetota bacterium]
MVRLHLVGFTTDLKNLIFADEPGARGGGFVVSLDARLRHTLDEVIRLEDEAEGDYEDDADDREDGYDEQGLGEEAEPEPEPIVAKPRVASKLTPKEIQSLLRQGKTEEQVARLAQTPVDWIQRFSFAILAERRDVIEAVKAATLSKPRLGLSGINIGEAVEENLGAKRLRMGPEAMDEAWKAVRRSGRWHVSFEYVSRGQKRMARFSFDPATRLVEPLNEIALELGWRADPRNRTASPNAAPSPRVSGSIVKPTAARSTTATPRQAVAGRPASAPVRVTSAGARINAGAPRTSATTRDPGGATAGAARPGPGSARPGSARPGSARARSGAAGAAPEDAPSRPRRSPTPPQRTPLPQPEPPAPRRRTPPVSSENEPLPPGPPERKGTGGFTIGKPKTDRPAYSSLPKVWRPSRRP